MQSRLKSRPPLEHNGTAVRNARLLLQNNGGTTNGARYLLTPAVVPEMLVNTTLQNTEGNEDTNIWDTLPFNPSLTP